MNLREFENYLIETIDSADSVEEAVLQEELSIIRRAIGYSMSPDSQKQFVRASRRELEPILINING